MPRSNERTIELIGADLQGPLRKEMLRRAAQEAFGKSRAQNLAALGYPLPESLSTDGVANKPPEEMRIGGASTLTFGQPAARIIPFTLELLERVSPRGRSNSKPDEERYYRNHAVFIDGQRLEAPYLMPLDWTRMVFVNLRPYDRKIERGLSKQRPNGVYEALVLPEVQKEFGDLYYVSFNYEGGLVAAYGKRSTRGTYVNRAGQRKSRRRKISDAARARKPAIIVENYR